MAPVWVVGIVLSLQVPPPAPASVSSAGLRRVRREIGEEEAAKLSVLSDRLVKQGDRLAADEVRARIEPRPRDDGPTRFVPLPEIVPASTVTVTGGNTPSWRDEIRTIRESTAGALFALAGRASEANPKLYALADECLRAVLERHPDHREARRLLGYVPHAGGWATPYAVRLIKAGSVPHATFGWVPASWVPHLERGDSPAPMAEGQKVPRWLPADEADRLHGLWQNRWTIPTEHFEVQTNVPLSEAIAFGRQLETFHDLFTALLADVIAVGDASHLPLAQRFQNKAMEGEKKEALHQVYYFGSKEEYVEHLTPTEGPEIEQSLGFYKPPIPGKGRRAPAYFYRDPNGQIEATATLYHEVSHQLLFEMAGPNARIKNVGNYWVFEGLGTYFETVESTPEGALEVGGLVGPRIEQAKIRLLRRGEFVPTAELVAMTQARFNSPEAVHLHYAESMALTVFLMQARGRAYREGFLDYVKDAYRGRIKRDVGQSLTHRLGVPYKTLDDQFLDYLKEAEPRADAR